MPEAPAHPSGRRRALLLPRPVPGACPAPPELEEPPELLLLPVDPAARTITWHVQLY
jgi:hypothetical protein